MKSSMLKYRIGFAVLGVFTLVLFIVVIVQASGTKQDNQTYKKATEVANKLNDYTGSHPAPTDLSNIGVSDIPSTIAYKKITDSSYKFCVTYKSKSANFSASDVETGLLTGSASSSADNFSSDSTAQYYLTIDPSHDKGQNCQTIKTYYYGSTSYYNDPYSGGSGSSGSQQQLDKALQDCNTKYPYMADGSTDDAYNKCVDQAYNQYDSGSNSTNPNTFSN